MTPEARSGSGLTDGMVSALEESMDQNGDRLFFAGTVSGVYQSMDLGQSWRAVAAVDGGPAPVLALGVSPFYELDSTIFVGSQDGLWRSFDSGERWNHVLGGSAVNAVILPAGDEQQYTLFVGTEKDGVIRSDDAGRNWSSANPGLLDYTVLSLAASPSIHADPLMFAGTTHGLYMSTNSGKSWRSTDLPVEFSGVECLAVIPSPSSAAVVLAGSEADGMFRSDDSGCNWEIVPELRSMGVTAIACCPDGRDGYLVACATGAGIAISADSGGSWRIAYDLPEPALALRMLNDTQGVKLLAGLVSKGLFRLAD